jgi:hypothetical protein
MAVPGTMGKILMVDLTQQTMSVETPSDETYLRYFGGYGLGAYYLYKLQKPGVDALGPENHLGFFTGVLTGTPAFSGNRYFVVAKSPKTGTWGDANSGGTFGPIMKWAGFDGVIFRASAPARSISCWITAGPNSCPPTPGGASTPTTWKTWSKASTASKPAWPASGPPASG